MTNIKIILKKLIEKALSLARHVKRNIVNPRNLLKDIFLQNKVAKIMDNYIADFLNGKIEQFSAIPKKQELIGKKIIWQYWHSGINGKTPKIVINCLNSVKKNCGEYEIILLTEKNLIDYVILPDFIWEKLGKGMINLKKLSNLVRLYLLSAYGGVWIDATIYLTKPIEENLLQKDFFVYQRSQKPPHDASIYKKLNYKYFSWNPKFQVRMLNSFMIAKPNNKIINDLLSIHLEYWRKEEQIRHYFFFQILFNRMMKNKEWEKLNCEIVGDTDCHKFQTVAFDKFDYRLWDEIVAKSNIHKLTYFDRKRQIPLGSFADIFTNGFAYDVPYNKKRNDITFCTILFRMPDENRLHKIKKQTRTFDSFYLESLKRLIIEYEKVVLWCDQETGEYLKANDLAEKIKMKVMNIYDLPRFKKRDFYLECLKEEREKKLLQDNGFLKGNYVNRDPQDAVDYLCLNMARYDVVDWAVQENFYNSQYFVYFDAGVFNPIYSYIYDEWDGIIDAKPACAKVALHTFGYNKTLSEQTFLDLAAADNSYALGGAMMMFSNDTYPDFFNAVKLTQDFCDKNRLVHTDMGILTCMIKLGYGNLFELSEVKSYHGMINAVAKQSPSVSGNVLMSLNELSDYDACAVERICGRSSKYCSGCSACANVCPKLCIIMRPNKEGFDFPVIIKENCTNCGLCEKVCPVRKTKIENNQQIKDKKVFVGWTLNHKVQLKSSSGGLFSELALEIFNKDKNAAVFGAGFDSPYRVKHIKIDSPEQLDEIRRSKYVQSRIDDIYKQVANQLKNGGSAMFCGTPCQCAGLYSFLSQIRQNTDNLFIVDFLCNSINSPAAFCSYLNEKESKEMSRVVSVNFKGKKRFSWQNMGIHYEHQICDYKNWRDDAFYQGWWHEYGLFCRLCCDDCLYQGMYSRVSDITLADAWGVKLHRENSREADGVSLVFTNTEKGESLLQSIIDSDKVFLEKHTIEEVAKRILRDKKVVGKYRSEFFAQIGKNPYSQIVSNIKKNGCETAEKLLKSFPELPAKGDFSDLSEVKELLKLYYKSYKNYPELYDLVFNGGNSLWKTSLWNIFMSELTGEKIGIMTYFKSDNYGAQLQAFALANTLKKQGFTPYFLDVSQNTPIKRIMSFAKKQLEQLNIEGFRFFLEQAFTLGYSGLAVKNTIKKQQIKEIKNFVIGSDEVWNLSSKKIKESWGYGIPSYITYAVSMGSCPMNILKNNISLVKKGIKNAKSVGVRDNYTLEAVKQILPNKEVSVVCDPTFLMTRDKWQEFETDCKFDNFILVYSYHAKFSQEIIENIKRFALEKNLKLVSLVSFIPWCDFNIAYGLNAFLSFYAKASFVITDTFHGAVFSLIYGKKFVSLAGHNKKVCDLIERFDLQKRTIEPNEKLDYDNFETILEKEIDDELLQAKISEWREQSINYLSVNLSNNIGC